MGHVLLPHGHTEHDRRLAECIAVALESDELVVCRPTVTPRPEPRRVRPAQRPRTVGVAQFVGEFVVGWSLLWEAVSALGSRRRLSP